jgi:integrase/recombinase XerD
MSNVSNVKRVQCIQQTVFATSLQLATYLNEHGYAKKTMMRYITVADRFQSYLSQHHVTVEAAKASHVESYLKYELRRFRRRFRRRYGEPPTPLDAWYRKRTSPVRILLRVVQGQWPPAVELTTPHKVFHKQLIDGYSEWLAHCRGLDARTIAARHCQWKRFLNWLTERGSGKLSLDFTVGDVDAYLQVRAPFLRRSSRSELTLVSADSSLTCS